MENSIINRLLPIWSEFIKPHWYIGALSIALTIIGSILEIASTSLVLPLTQILGSSRLSTSFEHSSLLQMLVNFYTYFPKNWQLPAILLSLLLFTIIKNISLYFSNISISDFTLRSGALLREKCIERFLELEIPFYNQTSLGELMSYVNEQAQRSESLFSSYLQITREIILITFFLWFLITLSFSLTIITVASLTIVTLALRLVIQGVQFNGRRSAKAIENFSSLIAEIISGIRVIKSFSSELRELDRTKQSLHDRYTKELAAYKFTSAAAPLTETSGILVLLIILFTGTNLLSSNGATLPILLTYALALLRTIPRVSHLNNLRANLSLMGGSFEAIQIFLSSTAGSNLPSGSIFYNGLQSELVLENLSFTYPSNSESTLNNINLCIPKGKTTAIVGTSGSGKSTLVDLVMRFYDPNQGSIKADGIDLRELKLSSWRGAIAMVSQDTFLFNASVRYNIAYGSPDATDLQVIEASKKAYAYEFIQDLPQGFDTIVGNRGTKLSGGQRQRIAIARAILCNPDILILDEATSALDSQSEEIVQKAIEEVSQDCTIIVIAHRLSTVQKADNIVVLQRGKIVQQGIHTELIARQGMYYSLSQSQLLSK